MTIKTRVSGVWRDVDDPHVRVSGTWRDIENGWVKVSGTWRQFYERTPPPPPPPDPDPPWVNVRGGSLSGLTTSGEASAYLRFSGSSSAITGRENGSTVYSSTWCGNLSENGMTFGDFELMYTVSGTGWLSTTPGSPSTWLSLGSSRTFEVTDSTSAAGWNEVTLSITIRDKATGTISDTGSWTLRADYDPNYNPT